MKTRVGAGLCIFGIAIGLTVAWAGAHAGDGRTSDSTQPSTEPGAEIDDLPIEERQVYEDALIESAEPAPDEDGDPTTLEGTLPDGSQIVIDVQTNDPQSLEGVTVDTFGDQAPQSETKERSR